MNARRGGLGRGLAALLPTAPDALSAAAIGGAGAGAGNTVTGEPARSHDGTAPAGEAAATSGTSPAPPPAAGPGPSAESSELSGPGAAPSGPGAEPTSPADEALAVYSELPVAAIRPNPRQPRTDFDEDALDELAASIREVGVLQPVVVRPLEAGRYELVMGERRWRATQRAGLATIPAIVRRTPDDLLLRDALLENLHRAELNPLEEASAYAQLLEDFGATHEELARRLGRSRPQITNTLRLLQLPAGVQRRVAAGVLSAGHARALLSLPDQESREALAARIVAEGLSVRATEEIVATRAYGPVMRRTASGPRAQDPRMADVAGRLSEHFETKVKVVAGRAKGRITIEFAGGDDLERILERMALSP